jgi:hypothetical protein
MLREVDKRKEDELDVMRKDNEVQFLSHHFYSLKGIYLYIYIYI